jgi:hypothetical protein
MPINIAYMEDGGIMATGEGVVTGSEIKEVNNTIYESPEKIQKIAYQLCDFSNISGASASTFEIEQIASQDKKASEINPNMLVAIVVGEDLSYGLSRMWESFSYGSTLETMVFRKVEDAQQWIREELQNRP